MGLARIERPGTAGDLVAGPPGVTAPKVTLGSDPARRAARLV